MDSDQLSTWLSLSLFPEMTPALFRRILQYFPDLPGLLSGPEDDFMPMSRQPSSDLAAFLKDCRDHARQKTTRNKISQSLDWARQENRHIITWKCPAYPPLLKLIPDAPPLLFVEGSAELLSMPQLAMVGSRKPSPGGRTLARTLAGTLAAGGYSICSGMALGIDAESHRGALENGGRSIAVLGCGIDVVYPAGNKGLARELTENGAIVSEFPLGAAPESWHFPRRNRIISGLSHGVVVIEAALRSGSLITARYALEQGREVFAVPGSVHNPMARGCHQLIKNGATLVEKAADIVEELGAFLQREHTELNKIRAPVSEISDSRKQEPGRHERKILKLVDHDVTSVDDLISNSGLGADEIARLLVTLELKGLIISRPGGYSLSP